MNIFVTDVDGVILDIETAGLDYINAKTGLRFTSKHITCWNWLEDVFGLTKREQDDAWKYIWECPAPLYDGAEDFIQGLKDSGYYVLGISYRPPGRAREAGERDFDKMGLDDYMFLDKEPKSKYINKYRDVRFFIDDKPGNVVDVHTKTDAIAMMMTRPWNANYNTALGRGLRVDTYQDVLDII